MSRRSTYAMTMLYAMLMAAMRGGGGPMMPRLPVPKPKGYGTHLSKAERRGKTWQELQELRARVSG